MLFVVRCSLFVQLYHRRILHFQGVSLPSDLDIEERDSWTTDQQAQWDGLVTQCQSTGANADPCCLPTCKLDRAESPGFTGAVVGSGSGAPTVVGTRIGGPAECTPNKDDTCCGAIGSEDQCKMLGVEVDQLVPGTLTPFDNAEGKIVCDEAGDCNKKAFCIKDAKYTGICPVQALKTLRETTELEKLWEFNGKLCNFEDDTDGVEQALNTCSLGVCQGSLCGAFRSTSAPDPSYTPTSCNLADPLKYCEVACLFEDGGECTSIASLLAGNSSYAYLAPGDGKVNSEGEPFPTATAKAEGKPCNNYAGLCQADGASSFALDCNLSLLSFRQ